MSQPEFFIHLVYQPWDKIPLYHTTVKAPRSLRYGHVYCLLEKDGNFFENEMGPESGKELHEETAFDTKEKRGILSLPFKRALRTGSIKHDLISVILASDAPEHVASFRICAEDFENALNVMKEKSGKLSLYDRFYRNCVYYAAADLRLAGIDCGASVGYTAGRFFDKVSRLSEGNLLKLSMSAPWIQVIERTLDAPKVAGEIIREVVDIGFRLEG